MSPFALSLISAIIVSLVSLFGIFLVLTRVSGIKNINLFLVSLAVGALLGDAFIHLIPESFENIASSFQVSILIILGILIFYSLENFLRWRHCHQVDCHDSKSKHPVLTLNLIGDSVHNFIDGILIAGSFIVSPALGLSTSLAVVLHEIPQEIGDFGIFLHHGLSVSKALFYNFISALFCLFGVLTVFLLNSNSSLLIKNILPLTAGGFIYLASSDLIPELHRHSKKVSTSIIQLFFVLLGIALMSFLLTLE